MIIPQEAKATLIATWPQPRILPGLTAMGGHRRSAPSVPLCTSSAISLAPLDKHRQTGLQGTAQGPRTHREQTLFPSHP